MNLRALALPCLLAAATLAADDRANRINEKNLRSAALKKSVPTALEILRNGGLRGFRPAPGCSLDGSDSVLAFLVQDIALNPDGSPSAASPLDAPKSRDFKIGDRLPYVMQNYPLADDGDPAKFPGRRHRRYAVPYPSGFDQDNTPRPIVAGIRDMTPEPRSAEYHTLGVRDLVSFVGVFPDYACYMGAYLPRKEGYSLSVGAGYANPAAKGIARLAHPLFPNPVPKSGNRWFAAVLQKTIPVGESDAAFRAFPQHKPNSLALQFVIGKRLPHAYGPKGKRTRPLDTVVASLGYNNVNPAGTAPVLANPSTQVELIYLTRELGYATRWEMWDTSGPNNPLDAIVARARKTHASGHLGPPADIGGRYSEHFEITSPVEDTTLGLWKCDKTITDPKTGEKETRTWYLVGGHDYTNLRPVHPPLNPYSAFSPANLSPHYLRFFGIPARLPPPAPAK